MSYCSQTYQDKELVILDDEDDPSFPYYRPTEDLFLDECGGLHRLRYYREPRRNVIEKRNRVNALATGDLIAHFDSDDWSSPVRLSEQVQLLTKSGKALTGYHTIIFYEPSTQTVKRYVGDSRYTCGTSMLYRRDWWKAHPFRGQPKLNVDYGSDTIFWRETKNAGEVVACDGRSNIVARVHNGQTNPTAMYKMNLSLSLDDLPAGFPRV